MGNYKITPKKHKETWKTKSVNKKLAVIALTGLAIIAIASQVNLEDSTEEAQIETVEEIEDVITIPIKAARPACGPNSECYNPSYHIAKIGETVSWKNKDSAFHSVTSGYYENPDGLFDSDHLDPDEVFSYTFEESGMYPYYCTLHPWMAGQIKVER